jgi:hypothetical protein
MDEYLDEEVEYLKHTYEKICFEWEKKARAHLSRLIYC